MDHRQIEEILEPDVRRLLEQLRGIFAFSPCLEPAVNWSAAVISLSDFGLPMTSLQGPDRQHRAACLTRRPKIISFKTLSCESCGGSQDAARLMVAESLLQEDLLSFKRFEKFGQSPGSNCEELLRVQALAAAQLSSGKHQLALAAAAQCPPVLRLALHPSSADVRVSDSLIAVIVAQLDVLALNAGNV